MGGPGTNYCMQCQQYFCGICKAQHNRQKVSRNHEFQSGENVDQEVKLRCEEHKEDFENGKTQTNQAEILPVRYCDITSAINCKSRGRKARIFIQMQQMRI